MSKCSKKCNEIKAKIDSISGLDDDWVYGNLLALESQVEVIVNAINKYADKNEVNGTCFNKKMSKEEIAECIEKAKTILNQKPGLIFTPLEIHAIKKGDYARLNTGEIVKVIGVKENKLNKKAIYFEPYGDYNWCDSMAVKSFSEDITDLIEVGDYVNGIRITSVDELREKTENFVLYRPIETILTREQYEQNCYKAGDSE